jgi:hypothetical protein
MRLRRYSDAGQAFPIYITVVAGLLFLAFAYFAVGQAAANRNGAQTAADAAALAAAQDTRDKLAALWVTDVLDPTKWQDIFNGNQVVPSCERAYELAAQNDAKVLSCGPDLLSYTVEVQTNKTVGHSVVPGTETIQSTATATAVIEKLCTFEPPGADAEPDTLPPLNCKDKDKDRDWELDPKDLKDLPKPQDLFDVHLAD